MNMKLTRRDKAIILVLIVLLITVGGTFLLLKPKYGEMQASNDRLVAKEAEKADVEAKIATIDELKKTLETRVDEIEELQKAFIDESETAETQKISTYLRELLAPSEIEITGVTLENLSEQKLAEYHYDKFALAYPLKINGDIANELPEEVYNAYNKTYPPAGPDVGIASTVVTVKYKCDLEFEQLYEAIQIIADHEKNIYLETCSAGLVEGEGDEDPTEAEGELTITVYELYPMDPDAVDKDPVMPIAETEAK